MEFFSGGGLVRLGLGQNWQCLLANDVDPIKCATYRENFGDHELSEGDIHALVPSNLPTQQADVMWGSFPCQDLSLAGARKGIRGSRSGTFFGFWNLFDELQKNGRAPKIIALENVSGLLTSSGGKDFAIIAKHIVNAGYHFGATLIDARSFVPQSRPRLFVFGFAPELVDLPTNIQTPYPTTPLNKALAALPPDISQYLISLPSAPARRTNMRLADMIDLDRGDWFAHDKTQTLIEMMAPAQHARLDALINHRATRIGAGYRRTRHENSARVQRFEARFDGLAGCLRTPAGGSSRQYVVAIEDGRVRIRFLSASEAARLMGINEDYKLPASESAGLKLCGDGVCVPVVQWIAENIFEPALNASALQEKAYA